MLNLRRPSNTLLATLGLALLLGLGFAWGEARGWPFLLAPLQDALSARLGRSVQLGAEDASHASGPARLQLWGGLRLHTPMLQVAAPSWSQAPHTLWARDLELRLRYTDIWRAWRGQALVLRSLHASRLDVVLERRADGLASWQSGAQQPTQPTQAMPLPQVESLEVPDAQLHYSDAPRALDVQAQATLKNMQLTVQLSARAAGARLRFEGRADDLRQWQRVQGHFDLQGPSLAAAGAPLGITLPSTGPFSARGQLRHQEKLWDMVLESAKVGTSQLGGHFVFDTRPAVPQLSGTLVGPRLHLVDLGPALGAEPVPLKKRARVLPSRPFDLASLRAMDADVAIALAELDLNTARLEPLRPLTARVLLQQGVLSVQDMDARAGQGHLGGSLSLNGQQDRAHWVADLHWDGVALEQWIHQPRSKGLPPYVSGAVQGQAKLQGNGRSTAEILASLQGRIVTTVQAGSVSHLLVEAGGLDLAESLGVMLQGDKPLALDCALADLTVTQGVLRPRVLVLDTSDSTAWIDGTLSLATETLDLRAVVAPKDLSPLTLRAPLHVQGSFAAPQISIEKGPLGLKLGGALLLGLINPLAAWIPLVDIGSQDASQRNAQACHSGLQKKRKRVAAGG